MFPLLLKMMLMLDSLKVTLVLTKQRGKKNWVTLHLRDLDLRASYNNTNKKIKKHPVDDNQQGVFLYKPQIKLRSSSYTLIAL